MSAITADQKYVSLLSRFVQVQRIVDGANLQRYHSIGKLFNEFCEGADKQLWGAKTVQRLAEDLQQSGVLSDISNPVRYLYWAKNIYDFDPSYEQLDELSGRGLSVTHAKLLFSLNDEIRGQIIKRLLGAERIASTRELESELRQNAVADASSKIVELSTPTAVLDGAEKAESAASPPSAAPLSATDKAPTAKPTKEGRLASVDKPAKEDRPVSPLGVLNKMEKLVSKVTIMVPDAFIAIKQAEKRGFDSDKASDNYRKMLSNVRAAIPPAVDALTELQKTINEYDT